PLFCWRRLECTADRLWPGSLCVDLEKIRSAAERVARSEGLEIVDVEWKVGKQRFLRVYIDRLPKLATVMSDAAGEREAAEAGRVCRRESPHGAKGEGSADGRSAAGSHPQGESGGGVLGRVES